MKCVHVDAEGFCGNKKLQGGGFKCCHCGAFTPDKQSIMKNNKSTVVEAEVVEVSPRGAAETEETRAVAPSPRGAAETFGARLAPPEMNRDGIVKTIARQIEAVRGAELRSTFEKLKLGAMVKQAVTLLGLEGRGRGNVGIGVKGWWDENFKGADGQPVIKYTTLMNWISAAEKLSEKMAVGGGKSEAIMCTLAKDPANVVGKEAKILKSAEKVANGMTMRQMLLWGDDEEARRPGRPKGSGSGAVEYKKKSALECAVDEVLPIVQHLLKHRVAMFTAYKILPDEKLTEFRDTLMEHVKAISAEIEGRAKR